MRCPGLQEGAIHREVLIAEQRLDLWSSHQPSQEHPHHLLIEQPLPVLGERGGVPDRIIRAQAHKPTKQQIVVELLQQKPLRADAVERLQQRGQSNCSGGTEGRPSAA